MKIKKIFYVLAIVLLSGVLFAQSRSLTTTFAGVILSGLKPGMVYSLKKEKNVPYKVINNTGGEEHVEVTVKVPIPSQIRGNYEPVPDVSWVTVFPTTFRLQPGESTDCDVIISIPPDKKYANRHFQAMLVTRTLRRPGSGRGVSINLAVASRLRFSTGPRPEKIIAEYRRKVFEVLRIELSPLSLFVSEVSPGKRAKLDGKKLSTLQLVNKGKENYKVEFRLADNPERYGLTKEYKPIPEEIKVKFKRKKMKAKKKSIQDVVIELKIPDKEEFYGKSYAFVVVGKVLGFDFPIELFARVYFKTADKSEMKNEK